MGRRNKRQRQLEALAQARKAQSGENEVLDIDDDEADSGDDEIEIDMESFSSVVKSNLRTRPVYYYGILIARNGVEEAKLIELQS